MKITYNSIDYDENDIATQVKDYMKQNGIEPRDNLTIEIDGQTHRFATVEDKHGQLSGSYRIYDRGYKPSGFIQDFRHGQPIKWSYDTSRLTDEQKQQLHELNDNPIQKQEQQRKEQSRKVEEIKRQKEKQAQDFSKGSILFNKSIYYNQAELIKHPYISKKKLRSWPFITKVTPNGELITAITGVKEIKFGIAQAYQLINADGAKWFFKGSQCKEASAIYPPYVPFEEFRNFEAYYVVEGCATASALIELLHDSNVAVFCALSANNIVNICKLIKEEEYNHSIPVVIGADNDEAGVKHATEAVKSNLADEIKLPPDGFNDWCDFLTAIRN